MAHYIVHCIVHYMVHYIVHYMGDGGEADGAGRLGRSTLSVRNMGGCTGCVVARRQ